MTTLDASPYIAGNYEPVTDEVTVTDLEVVGAIPAELEGRYLRNGPNPIGPIDMTNHHWFIGDGMVHGIRLRDGRAEWYRNRYVRSERTAELLGLGGTGPFDGVIGPNTNVIGHAGQTHAIVEAGLKPVELSYELESLRTNGFNDTLLNGFSAHPKYDPLTGEMHAMCYQWPDLVDQLQYVVIGPDGTMTKTVGITTPRMPMVHDMPLTQTYAVVMDLPVAVDFEMAMSGAPLPFRWFDDYEPRLGLLPRTADSEDEIIWCEMEPRFAFHPVNAYDDANGNVVIDICEFGRIFDADRNGPFGDALPQLARWTVDPTSQKVAIDTIDDRPQEFPRVAGSVQNRQHRYGYTTTLWRAGGVGFGETLKHDFASGLVEAHDHGHGREAGEPVFVGREGGSAEDDGWVMTLVFDNETNTSALVILDAATITEEVAHIKLPVRIPNGFHGNWVRDTVTPPPLPET